MHHELPRNSHVLRLFATVSDNCNFQMFLLRPCASAQISWFVYTKDRHCGRKGVKEGPHCRDSKRNVANALFSRNHPQLLELIAYSVFIMPVFISVGRSPIVMDGLIRDFITCDLKLVPIHMLAVSRNSGDVMCCSVHSSCRCA